MSETRDLYPRLKPTTTEQLITEIRRIDDVGQMQWAAAHAAATMTVSKVTTATTETRTKTRVISPQKSASRKLLRLIPF